MALPPCPNNIEEGRQCFLDVLLVLVAVAVAHPFGSRRFIRIARTLLATIIALEIIVVSTHTGVALIAGIRNASHSNSGTFALIRIPRFAASKKQHFCIDRKRNTKS